MKRMIVIFGMVISILMSLFSFRFEVHASSLSSFEQHLISDHVPNSRTMFATDLDGDGDHDLLASDRQTNKLYQYVNDGNQNFSEHIVDNIDAYWIDAADLDQDGDVDLAVVGFAIYGYEAHWYENQGDTTYIRHFLAHFGVDPSFIQIIDLDLDGDHDLVSNANGWNRAHLYWFENDGNENFAQHEIFDLASPHDSGCQSSIPVDMDEDGDFDLVQVCDSSPIFWLANDGHQNFTRHDISRTWVFSPYNIQAVDMDGDSDIDVLVANQFDGTFWFENDGFQQFTEHRISSNRLSVTTIWATDIDHDGDIDVVEADNGTNQVSLWINAGDMTFTEQLVASNLGGVLSVFVIDFDQDSDEDIIVDEIYSGKISWWEQKFVNQSPIVDGGGTYTVNEGESVMVVSSGYDPENGTLTYAWDLDNNGSFETPGESVTFSAVGLDGPSTHTIAVQVIDEGGLTATAQTAVNVLNVAPAVGAIAAPIDPVQVNMVIATGANFTDLGTPDTHTAIWDWDDGSTSASSINEMNGSGSVTGSHSYTSPGVYMVALTVTDDDGFSDMEMISVTVTDPTAPNIVPSISGTSGNNNWYTSDVTVTWDMNDPESGIVSSNGCDASTLTAETAGKTLTCSATNGSGLFSSASVTVKIDKTSPAIEWAGDIHNDDSFYFGSVPTEPTCTASDDFSGVNGVCTVTGFASTAGSHRLTATARDNAGNIASETRSYIVLSWTLKGFYQPVDMNSVYNIVKGGSAVPLKFEIFAGSTELTDIVYVKSLSYAETTCNVTASTDEIEVTATGGTSLRYDAEAGQFIYNWKTPKTAGKCYRVTMITIDGSSLMAYFKLK